MNRQDEEGKSDGENFILKAMMCLTNKAVRLHSSRKFMTYNSLHHRNDNGCKADGTITRP